MQRNSNGNSSDSFSLLQEENRHLRQQCAILHQTIEDLQSGEEAPHAPPTSDEGRMQHTEEALRIQSELAIALSATNDLMEGLHLVLDTVLQLEAIDCGGIYLQDNRQGDYTLAVHQGLSPGFVQSSAWMPADSPQAELIRQGKPLYQLYNSLEFIPDERRKEALHALAMIPIPHDDVMIACLNLASHTHDDIPQQTRVTLEAIAAQLGSTIVRITAETALHESQRNFQSLFNCLDDFLFVLDSQGTIQYINPAVERKLGYTSNELYGRSVLTVHPPVQHDEVRTVVAAMIAGETETCTIPLQTKDGRCIPVETRVTAGVWDGHPVLFGIARDMTERIKAEDVLRQSQEQLEERVLERTAQLFDTINELHVEIGERKKMEDNLRKSEERLRLVMDATNDGMWDWHIPSGEVYYSPRWQTMLGYEADELAGHVSTWVNLLHPDDKEYAMELVREYMHAHSSAYEAEFRLRRKDGSWHWILARGKLVEWDAEGQPVRLIGTHTDIHGRKVAEEQLRQSEERYRMLAENMRDVVWTLDTNEQFTYVSPSVYQLRGYTPEEVIQQSLDRALTPASLEIVRKSMQQPQSASLGRVELEQPCKDGSTVWTESIIVALRDTDSHITGWLGVSRDISDRRRAEIRMRQHAARAEALAKIATRLNVQLDLKTILNTVCLAVHQSLQLDMVIICLYDKQQEAMVFASESGVPAEVVPHIAPVPYALVDASTPIRIFADITQETDALPNIQHMRDLNVRSIIRVLVQRDTELVGIILGFMAGNVRSFTPDEQLLLRGIADQAALAITNAQLFDEVQQERALLSRRVAERTADLSRSNAELGRAVRAKDEFLANMSHELRTPLNAILGMSEALQEEVYGSITARQQQSLAMIERSGQHLLSLINDILDLSKIEAGKIELAMETISLETVCQASLQFIKQQATKKHISVSLRIDTALASVRQEDQYITQGVAMPKITILADERRLKQILINLLTNAVKFTPQGGKVGLDVTTDDDNQVVRFSVWDTGIGISPANQQRLFEPFIQVDSSLAREYEGTGLGLSLVMRLTELHGGSVALESEVGKGSRFTISLPQYVVASQPGQDEEASTHSSKPQSHPPQHVLIIEDSPGSIEQMTRYLQELDVTHIYAVDGPHALAYAQEHSPDLILLDILLSDISGWDILQQLKTDEATGDIPVVIVSVVNTQAQSKTLGAAGFLVKPLTRQKLQAVIRTIFPIEEAGQQNTTADPTSTATTAPPLILLAEDNESSITTVSDFLEIKGYEVMVTRNGLEAVAYAEERKPALVLMDIQMPKMDGLEAIRRIRASDTQLANVPIIALTALAMQGDRERCMAAGANEYLSKPVRLRELAQMIATFLSDQTSSV
jgi:PAS domain S-box-containing protein